MTNRTLLVVPFLFAVAGCQMEVDEATAPLACASNADCPGGLECEVEHDAPTCQPHGGDTPAGTPESRGGVCVTDADCGPGLECELEHGVVSCQPHRDASGAPTGTLTCATDADCGAGLECELEHGASWCQPHGTSEIEDRDAGATDGGVGTGMTCATDADCGPGLECEIEHGASWCQPHSSGGDR